MTRSPSALLTLLALLLVAPPAHARNGKDAAGPRTSCAPALRQGCERQHALCTTACPAPWSTNPSAPAFTPSDRAACTAECFRRHLSCLRLHGCG